MCPAAAAPPLERGKLASRSHAVAAQGAPCTVGGVFLHACVSVLCVFFVSPLGCSHHMNICGDVP